MILSHKTGLRGVLVDLDTGQRVPHVCTYNTDTGEWVAQTRGLDGKKIVTRGQKHPSRLKFIQGITMHHASAFNAQRGSGEEAERGPSSQGGAARRSSGKWLPFWMLEHPCEAYGCIHVAQWSTADEVILPPQRVEEQVSAIVAADGRTVLVPAKVRVRFFDRGKVVRTHYWCHRHYLSPGLQYPDGSIDRQEVQGGRPQ